MPYERQKSLTQAFGYTATTESDRVTCARVSEPAATLLLVDDGVVWPIRATSSTSEGAVVTLDAFETPNAWGLSEAEVAAGIGNALAAFSTCGKTLAVAHFVPPST